MVTSMFHNSIGKPCFLLAGVISLFGAGCKQKDLEPTPPELARPAAAQRAALQFKPIRGVGEEAQQTRVTTQSLPLLRSRLEIATIIVQAGKPITLPMPYEGVLELRTGSLATVKENGREVRGRGEMWQVAKGEPVTVQASGEVAVIRAIYLVPGEK